MISRATSSMTKSPVLNAISGRGSPPARNCSTTRFMRSVVGANVLDMLVWEVHGLPFERAELMEGLHLDPLDVLHRRHEPGDAFDIGWVVGQSGHERKPYPDGLADLGQPFGESQSGGEFAAGYLAIGLGVRTLDVEQDEIDVGEILVVGPVAQKSRCFNGRMKAHLLGCGKDALGKCELHHDLTAGDSQARRQATAAPARSLTADRSPVAPKCRYRLSDATYRDCDSTSSAIGSRIQKGQLAGRDRQSGTPIS